MHQIKHQLLSLQLGSVLNFDLSVEVAMHPFEIGDATFRLDKHHLRPNVFALVAGAVASFMSWNKMPFSQHLVRETCR